MSFLKEISQLIVENTSNIIEYPISISDNKGIIIGSSDTSRLGSFHQASLEIVERKTTIAYEINEVKKLNNVLPGVAAPIMINHEPIGVLGIVGEPAEVRKYAQLVKSHVELMCHEYLKKEMTAIESKTLDNLIRYLLNSQKPEDLEYSIRYAKMLGFDLEPDHSRICLLIEFEIGMDSSHLAKDGQTCDKYSWHFLQNNFSEILSYYLMDSKEDILSPLTLDQFLLIKVMNKDEPQDLFIKRLEHKIQRLLRYLEKEKNCTANISIGSANKGALGIKVSYQAALQALTAGKQSNRSPKIFYYNDWNIIFELLGNGLNKYVNERLKEKLEAFINHVNFRTLAQTFMAYCKCNMNMSETARMLFLHRNSLVYRMEKINELTSLDISRFDHCMLLFFAIKNSGISAARLQETKNPLAPGHAEDAALSSK
ncbi:helix-turn-helix domain-containing protein [Cytobacillus oceanisediminis]|uniref:CdaR family transcriptional regulator n=1 Tax=Cytobacillus TaxID=2675230 RepID=UPI00203D9894|nr:sugar diacid recognition domain-containing protein [Cytobacillus oceanisediminis]MBY0156459.1 helix-turn-helix domain-containing protein [Cytobacillus firmus]MCM3530675.1 helix-turn-helix domain-containing protein [Cytobacillus oceanisediminis]